MIIAFCGPSDSGKTTLIEKVKSLPYFKRKQIKIKGEDDFILLKLFKKFGGSGIISQYNEAVFFEKKDNSLKQLVFARMVSIFYPLVIYSEFFVDHILYEVIWKDKILLKDRYIYDYYISLKDILGFNTAFVSFLFERFPKPSLVFYLSIRKNTSLSRNKNRVVGKITSKVRFHTQVIRAYTEVSKKFNLLTIDSNKSISQTVKKIVSCIVAREKLESAKNIAFIGMDGAGKTTLVANLCAYARVLGVKSTIIHFYHNALLYRLLVWLGFFRFSGTEKERFKQSQARAIKTNREGKPFIWALAHVGDAYIQYLLSRLMHRSSLILYDRFFYDYLISFQMLNIRGRSLFRVFLPPIKHIFLVTCHPSVSFARKPENTKAFFSKSTQLYGNLSKKYAIPTIDTTYKSPEETLLALIDSLPL